jgi:hypothetical protein
MANNEQAIGNEDGVDSKTQPAGIEDSSPASATPAETHVRSPTAEHAEERLNPSAPGETATTPGTNGK